MRPAGAAEALYPESLLGALRPAPLPALGRWRRHSSVRAPRGPSTGLVRASAQLDAPASLRWLSPFHITTLALLRAGPVARHGFWGRLFFYRRSCDDLKSLNVRESQKVFLTRHTQAAETKLEQGLNRFAEARFITSTRGSADRTALRSEQSSSGAGQERGEEGEAHITSFQNARVACHVV